jgi:hypothetical protein
LLTRKYDDYYKSLESSGYAGSAGEGKITKEFFESSVKRYFDIARGVTFQASGAETDEKGQKIVTRLGYPLMRRIGWQTRNKPLMLDNRIILPLYSDGFDFSLMAITDDYGKTWIFSEPVVGAGNIQPALPMQKDSTIVAFMRDNGPSPHRLMKSISEDSGLSWSTVTDTDIPNPGSAADIAVLKSGNWILVHNDLDEGRHRLSVWLSGDEGKTWPFRKPVVNGIPGSQTRAHYPAIIQDSQGLIHVTYTNQIPGNNPGTSVKNIAHAVFSENWLMK